MLETFDFWSFIGGVISGGIGGALLTFTMTKNLRASKGGNVVDQSKAQAGGDVVGRDKTGSN